MSDELNNICQDCIYLEKIKPLFEQLEKEKHDLKAQKKYTQIGIKTFTFGSLDSPEREINTFLKEENIKRVINIQFNGTAFKDYYTLIYEQNRVNK